MLCPGKRSGIHCATGQTVAPHPRPQPGRMGKHPDFALQRQAELRLNLVHESDEMSAGPPGSVPPLVSPPAILPRRIVLTGFMGAGKSTVGRILAARLRWPFLDIDSLITTEHGRTVAQIFADHGEEHFRRIEAEATARVLDPAHEYDHAVIALGGGAIETEAVRLLLFDPALSVPATVTIFLSAP